MGVVRPRRVVLPGPAEVGARGAVIFGSAHGDGVREKLQQAFEAAPQYKPNKADCLQGNWAGLKTLMGEEELRGVDTKPLVGHLAAWNYFMTLKNPENDAFAKKYKDWAKKNGVPNAETVVTNDPMEATYVGIYMWKQAVEKARSTDTDKVIAAIGGQTFKAPSGFTLTMDKTNHHLHKPVMIGEVKADGQFNVVYKTKEPIRANPWSPFIPGNESKQNA